MINARMKVRDKQKDKYIYRNMYMSIQKYLYLKYLILVNDRVSKVFGISG